MAIRLQAAELEGLLAEAEKMFKALQDENAGLRRQLATTSQPSPAATASPQALIASPIVAAEKAATESQAAAPQANAVPETAQTAKETPHAPAEAPAVQAPKSTEQLQALAAGRPRGAPARRGASDAGLQGRAAPAPAGAGARRRSEGGARLPLAARTCLLRAQDALLAASPSQAANAVASPAQPATGATPRAGDNDAKSPAVQAATEADAPAAMVEESTLPALPFEGLSQRLSQAPPSSFLIPYHMPELIALIGLGFVFTLRRG